MLTNMQIITLMRSLFDKVYYSTLVWEGIRDRSLERPERFSSCPEADKKASRKGLAGPEKEKGRKPAGEGHVILLMHANSKKYGPERLSNRKGLSLELEMSRRYAQLIYTAPSSSGPPSKCTAAIQDSQSNCQRCNHISLPP